MFAIWQSAIAKFKMMPDNPPVGILLVTHKNEALVEYAISDADYDLFVSKYLIELPTKEQLNAFNFKELKRL
jgi:hypothetical protein